MYAKRLNKVYPVNTAQEKKDYLARGYDICDDDGEIIAYNPQKTVPYSEYEKLRREYEALRQELVHPELDGQSLVSDEDEPPVPSPGEQPESGADVEPEPKTLQHTTEESAPKMGKKK